MPLTSLKSVPARLSILIVEDSDCERGLLTGLIASMGLEVLACSTAFQALKLIKTRHIDMVITDWIMPGLSGLDLCRTLKTDDKPPYIIILTANDKAAHAVEGIESGGDDFIAKPFNSQVLRVRVLAGIRIVEMQNRLESKNQALKQALSKETKYLGRLQADLNGAARLQRSLLPASKSLNNGWHLATRFKPAQDLAGDIFQCFNIDQRHIGFYLLDVAGHGTAASMQGFALAQGLASGRCLWQSLDPGQIVTRLNTEFDDPEQNGRFATLILGIADTHSGDIKMVNAGHPMPLVIDRSYASYLSSSSQLPLGIDKHQIYEHSHFRLSPGQRLLLYSDGLYECRHPLYGLFGQQRLHRVIRDARQLSPESMLNHLIHATELWQNHLAQDDISLMLLSGAEDTSTGIEEES